MSQELCSYFSYRIFYNLGPNRCIITIWGILLLSAMCLNKLTLAKFFEKISPARTALLFLVADTHLMSNLRKKNEEEHCHIALVTFVLSSPAPFLPSRNAAGQKVGWHRSSSFRSSLPMAVVLCWSDG